MPKVTSNITVEGARIGFRNFSGKPGRFNKEGERSFVWFIDNEETARNLEQAGWNIRWRESQDGVVYASLNVAVRFGNIPPKIMLVHPNKSALPLDEETLSMLDWAELENVDMIIRPYNWEAQGRTGVKAYLKTMYVTLVEEDFNGKYSDVSFVDSAGYPRNGSCKYAAVDDSPF